VTDYADRSNPTAVPRSEPQPQRSPAATALADRVPRQRGGRHRRATFLQRVTRTFSTAAGRVSWGLADQAVSSITNVAVGLVVARSLGVINFGIFGLAWVTYAVILNISRGLVTDPLAVRFSGAPREAWRQAVAQTSGASLVVGLVTGVVCVVAGLLIGDTLGSGFIALGVVLPAVLLQDNWRFAFIAGGDSRKAFLNDVVWGVALIPAMLVASLHGTVWAYLLAWGASAAVAAVYGSVQVRILPRVRQTGSWLRQQRDLGPRYLVENVSSSGAAQIRLYGVGAIAGLAEVGAVRGSDLLMGPFLSLLMGLIISTIPEAARILRTSPHKLMRFCLVLGIAQATVALLWGMTLLFVLPDETGLYVLGPIWPAASALILPATLALVNSSLQTSAAVGLRALGASRRSMLMQLSGSLAYVAFGIAGAAVAGAVGSAWGIATATLLSVCGWWWQLRNGMRDHMAQATTIAIPLQTSRPT
jgi:O-antigen/teichoic acid export membrane protein